MVRKKISKELEVIKQSTSEALEYADIIIDTVREPVIALDQDLRVIKVNRSFYETFKVKPEETVGQHIYDLGNKQLDIPQLRNLLESIIPQISTYDGYEIEYDFPAIGWRTLLLNARQIQGALGKDQVTLLAIEDITERRQAENVLAEKTADALSASDDKYRLLVENINDVFYILDKQGNITYVSPAVERFTKYKASDLIGKPFTPIIYPDDLPGLLDSFNRLASGHLEPWEFRVMDKDGNILFVRSSSQPIYKDGQITGYTALMVDITEHKRAEEASLTERQRLHNVLEVMPMMVCLLTADYHVAFANRAFREKFGESHGRHCYEYCFEKKEPCDFCESYNVLRTGKPHRWEVKSPDGVTDIEAYDFPFTDVDGSPMILEVNVDITERKLSEEKLQKSYESVTKTLNDAINTMVKMVEMRDPYTAGHQQRVADLATAIAGEMKLEDTRIDQLRTAALIHDIGKMYIPSDILSKPGRLSDIEFGLIKTHAQSGYDIVNGMDFPGAIAKAVLQHHERLDGSGYPNQLKGEDTLLEAKILAVADVIEAMASHRPYRPALGIDTALEEISKNSGRLYDPDVVGACLRLFREKAFSFES